MKEAEREYYDIWEIWFKLYGRARVEAYDPEKSATYYVTKYVVKDICDWAINIRPDNRSYKLF
jgi:hypothetical protein